MNEQVTIYALVDSSAQVQYIGQTRYLRERRSAHRRAHPTLTLIVLTGADEAHADEIERQWIEHYRAQGRVLLNAPGYVRGGRGRPGPGRSEQVAFRVPQALYDELQAWAEQEDRSQSYIVRQVLAEALAMRAGRRGRRRRGVRAAAAPTSEEEESAP